MATDVGDQIRLSFTLTGPDGSPVSSSSMKLTITLPDQVTTVVAEPLAAVSPGLYQYDYLTTQAGRHAAQWLGTGTNPGAQVEVFDVVDVAPRYMISLASAKEKLRMTDDTSDEDLRGYIESATAVVERVKGEAMVRRSFTEEREVRNGRLALSWVPDVVLTSIVSIDESITWDVSGLHVNPDTGVVSNPISGGFLQLGGRVQITYTAGHTVIPANCLEAARIIIKHLWQTNRGSKGTPRSGGMEDTGMVPGFAFAVPNRALELLGSGLPGFA